jgi:hypothetical protein
MKYDLDVHRLGALAACVPTQFSYEDDGRPALLGYMPEPLASKEVVNGDFCLHMPVSYNIVNSNFTCLENYH